MRNLPLMMAAVLALTLAGCSEPRVAAPSVETTPSFKATRPPEVPGPGDHELAIQWEGKERTYSVHAPPSYRPGQKLPLVVALHYNGGDSDTMRDMTNFDAKADAEGFLVAYPNAWIEAYNALNCCGPTDDVGFIRTMVEHLGTVWGADRTRVYGTGISNGSDMVYRLAVEAPGLFAAIAPVSSAFAGARASDPAFRPSRPISVITFIGYQDQLRDRAVGGLADWGAKSSCRPGTTGWYDSGKTVKRTVASCAKGTQLVSYLINTMGHAWPGGTKAGLGDPTTAINAVDVMWGFFKTQRSQP